MRLTANAIVTNESGELLLIERHDIRTFDVPGGGLDLGELPTEAAVRETYEETGLHVRPSRLLGLYYWPNEPNAYLSFYFRCELLGGRLRPSDETPTAAFFALDALPSRILPMHRQRIQQSLSHWQERPYWTIQPMTLLQKAGKKVLGRILFPLQRRRRQWNGLPTWPEPQSWKTGAFTIIRNDTGAVLWLKRTDMDIWNLPGGGALGEEPPWATAVRETQEETGCLVKLKSLTGVYVKNRSSWMVFSFSAKIAGGKLTSGPEAAAFAWFRPGEEPANCLSLHRERVADACRAAAGTVFRHQDGQISVPPPADQIPD